MSSIHNPGATQNRGFPGAICKIKYKIFFYYSKNKKSVERFDFYYYSRRANYLSKIKSNANKKTASKPCEAARAFIRYKCET